MKSFSDRLLSRLLRRDYERVIVSHFDVELVSFEEAAVSNPQYREVQAVASSAGALDPSGV